MIIKQDVPALLIGIMSTMVSIGLARFAYTPLLPELIGQHWFAANQAVYLGAANLLGYFIGAVVAHSISERMPLRLLMSVCFAAVALSFIFCATPTSFEWFFAWRLISGIAGAILMVVGPASVIVIIPIERRASVGTLMFTGIGLGALLSATVIPLLVHTSLMATWIVLAALAAIAGLINDRSLVFLQQHAVRKELPEHQSSATNTVKMGFNALVLLVLLAYGFDALGFIPHTIFWVDYLAREQQLGTYFASMQWAIFGLGAMSGPFIARCAAQKMGWAKALNRAFLAKAIAILLPTLLLDVVSLQVCIYSVSSFVVGAMVPGVVSLTSGRIAEVVGPVLHKKYWGWATAIFALAQAISGYGMSLLYEYLASYYLLFMLGSGLLAIGFALSLVGGYLSVRK